MDIEVEGRADIGMSENGADSLIVAAALDAHSGETVAQAVELDMRNAEPFQHTAVIVAVSPRFSRTEASCEDVAVGVIRLGAAFKQCFQFGYDRNVPDGILCLGRTYDKLSAPYAVVQDIDSLYCLPDSDHSSLQVNVRPFQGADLSYPDPCRQAYVYPEIGT